MIKKCNKKDIPVIVLTNQAGVGRGYFFKRYVDNVNNKIKAAYSSLGARIDDFIISYTHPEGVSPFNYYSLLRKPKAGMAVLAAEKYDIDLSKSLMIGDKTTDNLSPFVGFFLLLKSRYHEKGEGKDKVLLQINSWLDKN